MRWLLIPFRLAAAWLGYNACLFGLHSYVWHERETTTDYGQPIGTEHYKLCKRCGNVKVSTWTREKAYPRA